MNCYNKFLIMGFLQKHITEILILIFLSITFILSGIEKITDWKGNINFITEHFKNSPLKNCVPFLLMIVLVIELIASVFMLVGIFQLSTNGKNEVALLGCVLSAVTILFLLIGQRLAKDYVGAMSLTVYFILTVFGVFLLNR